MTSLRSRTALLAFLVTLTILAAAAAEIWLDYRRAEADAKQTATDITRVVEKHISNSVSQIDALMGEIGVMVRRDGGTRRMLAPDRFESLNAFCRAIEGCHVMGVIDERGQSVAISGIRETPVIDVSNRDFFKVPVATGGLYIDAAITSRLPGQPVIFNIAKPVFDDTGKLLAVVSVGMKTQHFTSLYQLMGFSLQPTITVFRDDGSIVARHPDMQSHVGKNNRNGPLFTVHLSRSPSGTYRSVSVLDGKTRIAAYTSVPELGLVVFAGIETEVALRQWRERAAITLILIGTLLVAILSLLGVAFRAIIKQTSLEEHNTALGRLSMTDALTGVPNRRHFDLAFTKAFARHKRTAAALSVLIIDVDHFKSYNDINGHQMGDECIRLVATALSSVILRDVDLLARYGGEEFVAILDADSDGAITMAERLRKSVEDLGIKSGRPGTLVTVSVGVASTSTCTTACSSELLKAADRALYRAKGCGRNQVQIAQEHGSEPLFQEFESEVDGGRT